MDVEIKLEGFDQLARQLRELPQALAKNALRAAVNAGATEVRKEVQARAPVLTGRLRKSVYQAQVRELSSLYRQVYIVGVRSGPKRTKTGAKDRSRDAFYWRFLEFGTRYIAARPFLRPALATKKGAAIEAMARKLRERIERFRATGR